MKFSLKSISFLLLLSLMFTGSLLASRKWTLAKRSAGISVYLRPQANSPLKEFRGVMVVNASLSTCMAMISDIKASKRFMHNISKMHLVKQINPRERVTYAIMKTPWPVSNRDNVVHSKTTQNPKTLVITTRLSARPSMVGKKSGLVRVRKLRGFWKFIPLSATKTKVIYQVATDPAGSLPTMLVNSLVVDVPYNTLRNLRRMMKKPKYKNAKSPLIKDKI